MSAPPAMPALDQSLYSLDETESAFFKSQIGIEDDEELKRHICTVQEKAYRVFPYPCIRRFAFAKLKISRLPTYPQLLELGKARKSALLLDIGCCLGNDVRKAIADGYPVQNVVTSDIRPEYWYLGHELFKSTPETFPVPFVPGDAFDPAQIAPSQITYSAPTTPAPDLKSLTSLSPLVGHVSAIHASAFFHLFSEVKQFELAQRVASLLSPEPGSMIFGSHAGAPEKGIRMYSRGIDVFCHSPESWQELWDGQIFKKGTVRVEAELMLVGRPDLSAPEDIHRLLIWSVTRL